MTKSFADLGVPEHLIKSLKDRGIDAPFPIQAATLADALEGRDIAGKAPTGSGKTLAFALTIATRDAHANPGSPRNLVLVPTRELAAQVEREIALLDPASANRIISIYGGTSYDRQRKAFRRGVDTVVACPGRLEDLIEQGALDLRDVDLVVVDEADRMADMGFLPSVKRIIGQTAKQRQTLLFSATLDGEVNSLVKAYQHDPVFHSVENSEESGGNVEHVFWVMDPHRRLTVTAHLATRHERTVIFCRTRHGVERLAEQLDGLGISAVSIHGDKSQAQRERALQAFTRGRATTLVATDVAARGIHVDSVGCVVHYDMPDDPKDFLHRSGRTGRAGGDGVVVSLLSHSQRKKVRFIQRQLGMDIDMTDPTADVTGAFTPLEREARTDNRPEDTRPGGSYGGGGGSYGRDRGQREGGYRSGGGGYREGGRPASRGYGGGTGDSRGNTARSDTPRDGNSFTPRTSGSSFRSSDRPAQRSYRDASNYGTGDGGNHSGGAGRVSQGDDGRGNSIPAIESSGYADRGNDINEPARRPYSSGGRSYGGGQGFGGAPRRSGGGRRSQ